MDIQKSYIVAVKYLQIIKIQGEHAIKNFFFLILFSLQSIFAQTSTMYPVWENIKLKNPGTDPTTQYPGGGFLYEYPFSTSEFANGRLYVGTSPNGHIFSINPYGTGQISIQDHGSVSNPNNVQDVQALTHYNQYLFGASTNQISPSLFFKNLENSDQPVSFASDILSAGKIFILKCPKIDVTSTELNIYFGTVTTDYSLRIVKWEIPLVNGIPIPSINNNVEVIVMSGPDNDNGIYSVGLSILTPPVAQTQNAKIINKKVLICGTSKNQLIIYELGSSPASFQIINLPGKNTSQLVTTTDVPNIVWLFNNQNNVFKYNYNSGEITNITLMNNEPWDYPQSEYLYHLGYIYSYKNRINANNDSVTPYSLSSGYGVGGRKICTDGSNLFGISKWSSGDPILYKMNIQSLQVQRHNNFADVPINFNDPYGGSTVISLVAHQDTLFGCISNIQREFLYKSSFPEWIYNAYTKNNITAASATTMLVHNGMIYYGLYNRPYFAYKPTSNREFIEPFIDIFDTIKDSDPTENEQIYIRGLTATGNNILIGTSSRGGENPSPTTNARLLRFDIATKTATILATLQSACILSLASTVYQGQTLIYGASGIGIFLYNLTSGQLIEVIDSTIASRSVMIKNNKLYALLTGPKIRKYNILPMTIGAFFTSNDLNLQTVNGGYVNDGNGSGVIGNDGYMYVRYKAWKSENDQKQFLQKINIATNPPSLNYTLYNDSYINNQSKEIYSIGIDQSNINNKNIYVGFFKGQLSRVYFTEAQQQKTIKGVLFSNYPNPFNPTTNIKYQIIEAGFVTLKVYDLLGREIENLVNQEKQPGRYEVEFDASHLSSGIYFLKFQANNFSETRKMILMR